MAAVEKASVSPQAVRERPEAFNPFSYAEFVQWLWRQGRRQQAAFWFYVSQERSRPWADADKHGDGAAALRAARNDELGSVINAWIGSDLEVWKTIVDRALSYEAHLPLGSDRPNGVSLPEWQGRVVKARADYVAAARASLFTLQPKEGRYQAPSCRSVRRSASRTGGFLAGWMAVKRGSQLLRRSRRVSAFAAAFVVLMLSSGCVWGGAALYEEAQAETPVLSGGYRARMDDDPTEAVVSISGRSTYVTLDGQSPVRVLLIPMTVAGRRLWILQAPTGPDGRMFAYGLLERAGTDWKVAPSDVSKSEAGGG